jgi:hypothetical protein
LIQRSLDERNAHLLKDFWVSGNRQFDQNTGAAAEYTVEAAAETD